MSRLPAEATFAPPPQPYSAPDASEAFWRQLLRGFRHPMPLLSVASLRGPRSSQPERGTQQLTLPAALANALHGSPSGLTAETLVCGSWAALLARYCGETDVVFGVARGPGDPLPVRVQASPETAALVLLQTLQAQADAHSNAGLSLAQVHEWSDVPRGAPLFESVVALEGGPHMQPLVLSVSGGELRLHHDTARCDDATAARMLGHVQMLLQGMVTDPARPIAALPVLTEAEHRSMVHDWNATKADFPRDKTIHQLVEEQVARRPDAVAVVFEGEESTYKQINARANQLAHYLRGLGVKPGVFVAVCLQRSADMIVALLGILKAGGAYVPLDANYPRDRLTFMLQDTRAPVLVTQEPLLNVLPPHQARVICLDTGWGDIAGQSEENLPPLAKPEDVSYVIYTSGSTGRPKGVVLQHRAVVNTLDWVNETFHVGPGDRLLFVTSVCFDLSVYDLFGSLSAGGSIRVTTSDELKDPERLLRILCEEPITFWDSAPPQLQQLAPFFPTMKEKGKDSTLRLVFLSGDWIPVPLPDAIRATFPRAQVVSLGGATEAAIWSNYYPIGDVDPKWPSIPYGKPIKNARYHILDAHLNPVPIGVAAELHIGGDCVAQGYLNRVELTAERFIRDPFSDQAGDRIYKTGDLARYFPDGNIEFLGRIDHQVKIRGYRIELGEIEAVLSQHAAVRECVIVARADASGVKNLVGYAVPRPGQRIVAAELKAFLGAKLPDYMVPPHIVGMLAMPLNPNGKIDRKALPEPTRDPGVEGQPFEPPRNATEEALAAIWKEVLGVQRVGINDDFFMLGGHSLNATQVVSRIRQRFQIELPLPAFFQAPTIAALGTALQNGHKKTALEAPSITPLSGDRSRVPASFSQQRLWFVDQFSEESEVYNIPYAVRIQGTLNVDAFRQALSGLAARHESLRTTFIEDGQLMQVIAPPAPVELPVIDLSAMTSARRQAELERLTSVEGKQRFDLAAGPLWVLKLVRLTAEEHVLLLTLHHIVSDGWSMWVFFRDLGQLYENRASLAVSRGLRETASGATELPPVPVQYADFSQWQHNWFKGEVLQKQLEYWKQRLAPPLPTLQLPTARSRPATQTFRGDTHFFKLPPDLIKGVDELARKEGATPFMAWLAAFDCVLYRYTYQEDLLVGMPIANRNRAEIEGVVGAFINQLVIRTNVADNPSFVEVLRRVKAASVEAFDQQELPFDLLVQEMNPEREAGTSPIFQVLFNFIHGATQTVQSAGTTWSAKMAPNGTSKFDLSLTLEETDAGLVTYFEYNTDLFEAGAIERLAGHFRTLLEAIVTDPLRDIAHLPLLTEAERKLVLEDWNATRADYPRDRGVYQLVAEQAARTPDAVAVVFQDKQLTYSQLNSRANQLAHYLRTLGVGPDTMVGLCMERSADMVVGLLGILKAGGAYVPLDPAFPPERLAFYAEDSKMLVLVTQQSLFGHVAAPQARVVCLDRDWDTIALNAKDDPAPTSGPNDRAYVIFTSGSTGKPKGVEIVHQAMVNFLNSMRRAPGLAQGDILLSVTTLSFDIHVLEVWLPLIVGARVVIVSRDDTLDGAVLLERMEAVKATVMQATPATWRLLIAAGWKESKQLKVLCGGEPLTVELAQQLLERVGELWNMYGPTETTVWSTIHRIQAAIAPISIGRPIDNTTIYILDRQLNPVPVGAPGELHIGGDGLARGYLNRPELTAEKFIRDPFSPDASARIYKTGDVARYLPNGTIECLGRIDHQVKVRGFRIELGEIETVLGQHPAVRSCVVVACKDEVGADFLAAYVIPKAEADASAAVLRTALKEKLPDYMVPSYFVTLEAWPLTPNGKIDRKALAAPTQSSDGAQREIVPPTTDPERALAPIWEEVLKVKPISITDNFFDLGGHSYLAAVLIGKIRTELGHSLPLGSLFAAPTVQKLAALIQQNLEAPTASSIVPFHEEGERPPLFLIAGVGGHVFTFHRFGRLLGDQQPTYGVKAIGIDGTRPPLTRIEDMAAEYLQEITALRPKGPYMLGGYSVGALVAYELALQLRRLGHEIKLLVVFDMNAPGYPKKLPLPKRVLMHLGNFARLGFAEKKAYLVERFGNIRGRVYHKLGLGAKMAPEVPGAEALSRETIARVWAGLIEAQSRYQPKDKLDANVVLFKAEDAIEWAATVMDDPFMGWSEWGKKTIEEHVVPGGHMEVFSDKNINLVATKLRGAIQRVVQK
jgi:amino acid adenylation domain-containing protein